MDTHALNELTTRKLHQKIAAGSTRVAQTFHRIDQEAAQSKDFIGYVGQASEDARSLTFENNGRVRMSPPNGDQWALHIHAIGQLAQKLNVPVTYLKSLAFGCAEERELAKRILQDHSRWSKRDRVLVRLVNDEVRGVLSDQYRRLNSSEIITSFVQEAQEQGGVPCDAHFTDTRLHIETLYPKPIIFPTPKNGNVAIAFGARMTTSDYGDGALDMRFYMMQGVCLNGMVRESVMRQVHLGKRLPENLALSEETYRLDTAATASAVKDLTKGLFAPKRIESRMEEVQRASGEEVDIISELKNMHKSGKLMKKETEEIEQVFLRNSPEDGIEGESTLWKLAQGISAYGRDVEPERNRDLQEIAGNLMNRVKQ